MSELLESIILGIIQGLTEFLPVSSSGHLEIAKFIFGDESSAESSLLMTVVLHAATAISTIIVFRKFIFEIITDSFKKEGKEARKLMLMIALSMIPAVLVGLFMEEAVESLYNKNLLLVGLMLLITAILLYFSDRQKETTRDFNFPSSFWVGVAQAFAILPGISRSGATIAMSLFMNISRENAARFSFLMVIPIILGKIAKEMLEGDIQAYQGSQWALVFGFISALISGYLACVWMIKLVKNSKLSYFALYCTIVGIIAILVHFNQ